MRTPVPFSLPEPPAPPKRSRRLVVTREHAPIAHQLLADYNTWRSRCSAIQKRREATRLQDYKASDERLDLFARFAGWCGERDLDPRLFLFVLFRARRWFWPPAMDEKLMAEDKIEDYRRARGLDGYRRVVLERTRAREFDPNVDIGDANEARKRRLAERGEHLRCMEGLVEETLGYHPKSEVCRTCPVAPECATRLRAWCDGFDIMRLRLGEISPAQAQAAVREKHRR